MTARLHEATLDHALQIARDAGACETCRGRGSVDAPHCHGRTCKGSLWPAHLPGPKLCTCGCSMCDPLCRTCDTTGVVGELSPAVVTWLAQLALNHPQVSAAVAAALPTSGVRWAMPWTGVHGRSGSRDAARAEVDERLLAAGYTLLGEVYRRAAREPVPCTRCASTGVVILELGIRQVCGDCGGRGVVPAALAQPVEPAPCGACRGAGYFSAWGKPSEDPDDRPCMECDGAGMVPR